MVRFRLEKQEASNMRISISRITIAVAALTLTSPVFAQFSPGPNPIVGTVGTQSILSGTGTISSGGVISVSGSGNAITLSATSGSTTIINNGSVLQTGTGRTIRNNTSGTPSFSITNNNGALIRSADGDTIRADVAGSNWTINNSGIITSLNPSLGGSQAIDFDAVTTGTVSITNNALGQILAFAADAIRPGANATVINAGTVMATLNNADLAPSSDGIDTQLRSGVNITNTGTISGRHGITGGDTIYNITVTNNAGGIITGVNGSGVNIDGVFTTSTANVINAFGATIQGGVGATFANGDGDGVDVDGVLTLNNSGNIFGYGAKGVGSDLLPNSSQAVSIGGGTIINSSTGRIIGSTLLVDAPNGDATRAGEGILSDNSSGGNAVAVTTVTNDGLIQGKTGAAIRIVSTFSDSVTNNAGGTIRGAGTGAAIQTGNGANTVINRGAIIGENGSAIDLQGGDDVLKIEGGAASIIGNVSGGAGTNTFTFDPGVGNSFSYSGAISMFGTVDIKTGLVTLSGVNSYAGTTRITGGILRLDGTNRISASSALDLNGGTLEMANAGGANGQTFASFFLSDSSTIDLNSTSLTFNGLGSVGTGKTLTILDYVNTASPNYAFRVFGDYSTNAGFQSLLSATTINGHATEFQFDGAYTNVVAAPEPSSFVLIGVGGIFIFALRRLFACRRGL